MTDAADEESQAWLGGPYDGVSVAESKRRGFRSFKLWHSDEQPTDTPKVEPVGEPAVDVIDDPRVVIRARFMRFQAVEAKARSESYQLVKKHPWLVASQRPPRRSWLLFAIAAMFGVLVTVQIMQAYYASQAVARITPAASPAPAESTSPTTSLTALPPPEPAGWGKLRIERRNTRSR